MIWSDFSDQDTPIYFKTFIANPEDEDKDYRLYTINEGNSQKDSTRRYQFKKKKEIQNLYQYFRDDILV